MTLQAILWRDHTAALRHVPGLHAGHQTLGSDPAADARALFQRGIRHVELPEPVDLARPGDGRAAVRALVVVRELTSWGIVVSWRLVAAADRTCLSSFSHLSPPVEITGVRDGDSAVADLRRDFYLAKCVYRMGPGFTEVRDRRSSVLSRYIIDDPDYRDAIHDLEYGVLADAVPADVLTDLESEQLVARIGEYAFWLPYRVRRWPHPPLSV
ncbi:DUF5825 family protein [Spirillospora sp. NPDC052269]